MILIALRELLKDIYPYDENKYAAVTFVVDLDSLLSDAKKLPDDAKKSLCNEAWVIKNVIKRYKLELDDMKGCSK